MSLLLFGHGSTETIGVSGSISPSGSLTLEVRKSLGGATTPSGALSFLPLHLDGAIALAGAVVRQVQKLIAGSISPSGALSLSRQQHKELAGSISPSGWLNAGRVELSLPKFIAGTTPVDFLKKYCIYTSDDGTTWTPKSTALDYNGNGEQCTCLATDGSIILAAGTSRLAAGSKAIIKSADRGATWTAVSSPFDASGSGSGQGKVAGIWYSSARSLWMAVGTGSVSGVGNTAIVATSPDGVTWTSKTVPNVRQGGVGPLSVTYQNGAWWVGGRGGSFNGSIGILFKSTNDGTSWTQDTTQFFNSSGSVSVLRYAASLYVVGGSKCFSCSPNGALETSPDDTTWTLRTSALTSSGDSQCRDITYSSSLGLWVAVGGAAIVTSPDGATWTQRSTGGATCVVWSPGQAKFVLGIGTHAWTSTNGTTWTDRGVVTGGEAFAAVIEVPASPPPTYVVNEYAATAPAGTLSVVRIPSIGQWVQKASPTVRHTSAGMAAHGGKIYIFGGYNASTGVYTNSTECYDPATNSWSSKANMTSAMVNVRAITVGNDIWVFGDPVSGSRAWIYHPLTNTWSASNAAVGILMSRYSALSIVYIPDDGGFWTLQNADFPSFENSHVRMDPTNQAAGWVPTGPYRPGSFQSASPAAAGGRKSYHLAGAVGNTAHSFDSFSNTWTAIASPPITRQAGKAAFYNGEVWLVGGSDAGFNGIRKVELYDPVTNTWRLGPYDFGTYNMNAIEPDDPLHPIYAFRDERTDFLTTQVMFELFVPAPIEIDTDIVVDVDVYPYPRFETAIEIDVDTEDNLLTVPHARVMIPGFIHTGEEV